MFAIVKTISLFPRILLPPIILEATYKLYGRDFALQFDTIILLAVIGTLLNVFALGLVLYAMDGNLKIQWGSE